MTSFQGDNYYQIMKFYENKYQLGLKKLNEENLRTIEEKILSFLESIKIEKSVRNLAKQLHPSNKISLI